jgi:hypothetical protein
MSDATIAGIGRQLAEALTTFAHERTSMAGVQAQKDIARLQWELCSAWREETGAAIVAIEKGEVPPEISPRFARGDSVYKGGGDYLFRGRVAFSGYKLDSNVLRYVVQDDRGLLMIMNEGQLRLNPRPTESEAT